MTATRVTSREPQRVEPVRILRFVAVYLAALIVIALTAVMILSRTDWGRERVRRFALSQLEGVVAGKVTIGRVSGNLLTGATVDAVVISDSAGQPFFAAEQVSARYHVLDLLTRRLDLHSVRLVRPMIVLDRPPGGKWNYQRIFPPSDTTKPRSERDKGFPWIILHDVTMLDGHFVMRTPWKPDTTLSRAAQASSVAEALGGKKRIMVVATKGGPGYQKVVELREVTARAPIVRITQPGFEDRLARIATLKMVALPFRPPAAIVHDMVGGLRFNNDSIWWDDIAVKMPGSSLRGDGRYVFSGGDMTIAAKARPAAFADFRFVLPRLPSDGGGPLDFALEWRGTTEEYWITNADVRSQGARMRGKFAISFADTFAIHSTDVRFSNVSTKLVEQLVPEFESPRRGTLDGQLTIEGGRNAMQLAGNVAFHDPSDGTSRVSGRGAVGYQRGGEWRLRNVSVRVDPLQVALLRAFSGGAAPFDRIGGTLVGTLRLNGSTSTALAIAGDVEHRDRGALSRLSGSAGIRFAGANAFNIEVVAHPIALREIGLFAPSLGLRGSATGPIRLEGTLSNLRLSTDLRLSDGGRLFASGRVDLEGRKSYDLTGGMRVVDLHSVMSSAPRTSLTANVSARGSGFQLATMNGAFAADFAASTWDSVSVDSGSVRVAIANGMARVDRLLAHGRSTHIDAAGTFGLAPGRVGELQYRVAIDSLGAYNRLIPGAPDTGVVRPRTALVSRALERAREDSIRIARATEVERAATGRRMPAIPVDMPPTIARRALSGSVYTAGVLRGNIEDFDLRGRFSAEDVVARGSSAKSLRAEYAWTNVRTATSRIAVGVEGRSIMFKGFAFDTLEGRLAYARPNGEVQLAVRQGDDRDYSVRGTFVMGPRREIRVNDLALRMDTTVWRLAHPALVYAQRSGVELRGVELRSNTGGVVSLDGTLPTQGNANLVLDVQNVQIADIAGFLQSDFPVRGILAARGRLEGTPRDPRFRGALGLAAGSYNESTIPNFRGTFTYANASLSAHIEAIRRTGEPTVVADATIPINLALTGVTGDRLLERPMNVEIRGDSLPIDLIPAFTDVISNVRGHAAGTVAMGGTLRRPTIAGGLVWTNGSFRIVPTGMTVNNIVGSVRMARDTVFVDSIAGQSGGGPVKLTGRLYVGNWREPAFDLHLIATDAQILNNDRGRLDADAGLSLTGPFDNAYVAGALNAKSGVVYIPESNQKTLVNADDPALFAVVDTSVMYDRELFPASSPLLENMRVDVDVSVQRTTWVRSRDANIEVFTEEPLRVSRQADALGLTGVVSTDRGEYTFLSKRFQVKRGSATFIGGPELNPIIQATGEYEVAIVGRPNFNIRVLIGGTIQKPKLTLESDAQPPIAQADLLSYLAFGQSSSSLLQLEGSGLSGSTATGDLVGVGAAIAMKRMAAVALGVMIDEIEGDATKGLGADVFNIMPAEIPEFGGEQLMTFFQSTRIEAGKYLNPNLFVAFQIQQRPGMFAQYRTPKGWRYEASIEPRYLLEPPTLAIQKVRTKTTYGAFIIREWRF